MKKYLIVLLVLAAIQGCTIQYVEVYKTESGNAKKTDNLYVYENDTIRIDYRFWDDGGVLQFRISNKSDKPIYIDWKKCAFISQNGRYDYWSDKATTNISFRSRTDYDAMLFPGIPGFTSVGNIDIKSTKRERVTFIPPKSYIALTRYPLVKEYLYIDKRFHDFEQHTEPLNANPKKQTIIYTKKYNRDNSIISFRNFLTFSFKEDFSTEFYADNDFYVKEINEMDEKHFSHNELNKNKDVIKVYSYQKGTDFYKIEKNGLSYL